MPQSIKFYGPGGKVYDMPWNKPTPPTDQDKEDFALGKSSPIPTKFDTSVQADTFSKVPFDTNPPSSFNRVPFDRNPSLDLGLENIEDVEAPPTFAEGAYNKVKGMASGAVDFTKSAIHHPAGIAGVMAEQGIESAKKVKKAWDDPTLNSNPGMKAAEVLGKAASVPFDTLGLPVSDTAESIIKGDIGGATVSGLASLLPFKGNRGLTNLEKVPTLEKSASLEPSRTGEGTLSRFTPEQIQTHLKPTQYDKILGSTSPMEGLGDFWRSLGASFDMSAPLRQGIFLLHKGGFKPGKNIWAQSFKPMFEAAISEPKFEAIKTAIKDDPMFVEARQDGLAFTDLTKKKNTREEMFTSELAEKIPGVRHSGRAYTTFLNKLRFDTYKSLIEKAKEAKLIDNWEKIPDEKSVLYEKFQADKAFTKRIAEFVNNATGRGDLGRFESAADALSRGLYAPRLVASRFNMLKSPLDTTTRMTRDLITGDKYGLAKDAFVGKEYAKSLAALGAFNTIVLGLGYAGGKALKADVDVEMNPTSSDFAKLRIGNTRADFTGGVSNYIKLLAQIQQGYQKSSITGKESQLNTGKFGGKTKLDKIQEFIIQKEAPGLSYMTDALKGEDFKGNKFSPIKGALDRSYPMIFGDTYELGMDDPKKLPLMIPAFFGAGVQTYRSNPLRTKRSPYSVPGIK